MSRTTPEQYADAARSYVRGLAERLAKGTWIEARGRRCRFLGVTRGGGVRIDGEDLKPRSISITDLAWALAARDDVAQHGGVLDEARVNRLRYLDGTPKASTRWIDTGWALVWLAARPPG